MRKLIALIPIFSLLLACAQHEGTQASTEGTDIAALSDSWEEALNAGNMDDLVGLYAAETVLMPPNGVALSGRQAAREMFGGMMAAGLTLELTTLEARAAGDIGYNVGTYTMRAADGSTVDVGKFMEIWRQDEGTWRIAYDTWNSDRPAAAEGGDATHIMILHEVDDAEHWMAAWRGEDSRHKLFKAHGAAHVHAFHNPDKPNLTGLVVAVKDMDALQAMLASEEGIAAATEDGVRMDTVVTLEEVE